VSSWTIFISLITKYIALLKLGSVTRSVVVIFFRPLILYFVLTETTKTPTELGGGGVLIAVSNLIQGVKRRHDLETTNECVWIEIPVRDSFNLLIGNHYFPPDCKATIIDTYLQSLEQNLNAHQYRVIMLHDFNVPNYNWTKGAPLPNSYY
jgi:hypothetical protein